MRRLVDVYAALVCVPGWDQQPGLRFADELVAKDGVEFVAKRQCIVLRFDQVTQGGARVPGLSPEPAVAFRLPEDRRPAIFVELEEGFGPDAKGKADRENTPGRCSRNQIEVAANRFIKVFFQTRQKGSRLGPFDPSTVNTEYPTRFGGRWFLRCVHFLDPKIIASPTFL